MVGRWGYYFILPGYVLFVLFSLIPMFQAFMLSFYDAKLTTQTFIGVKNYAAIFKDPVFIKTLWNTAIYTIIIVPAHIVISLFIAVVLSSCSNKAQSFYRAAFYLPNVLGGVIVASVWLYIFHPLYGMLNYFVTLLGASPISWLSAPGIAKYSLSFVVVTWTIGQSVIIFLAGMGGIPQELYEAAYIDGSTDCKNFFYITLPLLRPVTSFVLTTQLIGIFQLWEVVYMLTEGGPANSTSSLVFYIYKTAFERGKYGAASAQGMILLVIIMLMTLVSLRLTREKTE
ncbi:MAG: sugar ABC transporter permease [Synergistaceae bacterium]|nr:sugar ABC transporter permease [Synergistaceae bacterium]